MKYKVTVEDWFEGKIVDTLVYDKLPPLRDLMKIQENIFLKYKIEQIEKGMTKEEFVLYYNSKYMYAYAMDEERCHIGSAPILLEAFHNYGRESTLTVIDELLNSLITFTSARFRLSTEQRERLAQVVLTQFPRMRITELILFVVKAQAGAFGKFYDRIDPIDITTALSHWWGDCQIARNNYRLARYNQEQESSLKRKEEEYARHREETMSILLDGNLKNFK